MSRNLRSSWENVCCRRSRSETSSSTVKGLITSFVWGSTMKLFSNLESPISRIQTLWQVEESTIVFGWRNIRRTYWTNDSPTKQSSCDVRIFIVPRTTFNAFRQLHPIRTTTSMSVFMGGYFILDPLQVRPLFSCLIPIWWYGLSRVDLRKIDRFCLISALYH